MGTARKFIFTALFVLPLFAQAALININTALSEELQTLTGIGPAYAKNIIDYRTLNGPFQKIEDIKNVKGIGDVTFGKIKDQITVGNAPASPTNSTASSSAVNVVEQTDPAGEASAHYNSVPITKSTEVSNYKIGAGRARLSATDVPMEFRVNSNVEETGRDIYTWSFGDGSVGYGQVVSHSYAYSGEYVVVLNASSPAGRAVSRTEVKIVPADVAVTYASPDRIEVANNGKTEVNLFGRGLSANSGTFSFPEDTIIKAGQRISFPVAVTRLAPITGSNVSVSIVGNSLNKNFVSSAPPQTTESKPDEAKIQAIYDQILDLEIQQIEIRRAEKAQQSLSIASNTEVLAAPIFADVESPKWFSKVKHFFGFK